MGQKLTTTRNCVAVWVEQPVYYSGDVVQGYVLLNVVDSFAAGSVDVEIKGSEKTSWRRHETHTHTRTVDGQTQTYTTHTCHPHRGKKVFLRVTIPLATFSPHQPLPPGQYQFPFRAQLPVSLPGSFRFHDSRDGSYENIVGKVGYKVSAEVVQGERKGKLAPLHDCARIEVRQRLARPPSELLAEAVTDVNFCCCLGSRGAVVLRMRADKDAYAAGETAYLLLEVDNRTSLAFPSVVLKVQRAISLVAGGALYHRTDTVYKYKFPGLAKGMSYLGTAAQRLAFPLASDLAPTTQAGLVTCSYHAWVELSAGTLTNNPKLCVPLTIYASPPAHESYSAAPAYWRPQMVNPPVYVALPGAPPFDPNLAATAPPMPPPYGTAAPPPQYGVPVAPGQNPVLGQPLSPPGKDGYEASAPPGQSY